MRSRLRSTVGAVIVLFVVSIAVCEVGLRVIMGRNGHEILRCTDEDQIRLVPDVEATYSGYLLRLSESVTQRVNEWGYRGAAPGSIPGTRIIAMGDSFTYGMGVQEGSSFPDRAQAALARTDAPAQIMNFGIPGFNLVDLDRSFAETIMAFEPAGVVYFLYENDAQASPCIANAAVIKYLPESYILRLALLLQIQAPAQTSVLDAPALVRKLALLDDVVRTGGGWFAVGVLSYPPGSEEAIASLTKERRIELFDLRQAFRDSPRIPDEGHFSREGNQRMGEAVADLLLPVLQGRHGPGSTGELDGQRRLLDTRKLLSAPPPSASEGSERALLPTQPESA